MPSLSSPTTTTTTSENAVVGDDCTTCSTTKQQENGDIPSSSPSSPSSPSTTPTTTRDLRRKSSIPQTLIQFLLNSSSPSSSSSSHVESSSDGDELINSTFYVGNVHAFQSLSSSPNNFNNNNNGNNNGRNHQHHHYENSPPSSLPFHVVAGGGNGGGNGGRRRASSSASSSPRIRSKSATTPTSNNGVGGGEGNHSPSRLIVHHQHSFSSEEHPSSSPDCINPTINTINTTTTINCNNMSGSSGGGISIDHEVHKNSDMMNNSHHHCTIHNRMKYSTTNTNTTNTTSSSSSSSLHYYLQPLPEKYRISENDLPSLSLPPNIGTTNYQMHLKVASPTSSSSNSSSNSRSTPTPTSTSNNSSTASSTSSNSNTSSTASTSTNNDQSKTPRGSISSSSGKSSSEMNYSNSNSFSEGLPQTRNNVRNFFREKSFQITTNIGGGMSVQKARKINGAMNHQHSSIGWWEKFDLMPLIFSFISRSEQRCILRWVCKRWTTILIDADYDTCTLENDEVNTQVTRRSTIVLVNPNSQKKAVSSLNSTLSQVALIHHFVARDFSGEESLCGILYKFCSLLHSRLVRQDLVNQFSNDNLKSFELNEREKQEWESQIKVNIWSADHWKIMNDLRKKRSTISSITPLRATATASSTLNGEKKKKLGTLFNKTTPNSSPDTSSVPSLSPNSVADDLFSELPPLFFTPISMNESPSEVFKRTLQERHESYCNMYLQFFYMVSQQPLVYNELCKLCNSSLNLQKDNKQKNYNEINTSVGVYESMISNIASSKITPEMLMYKLFERVFTLDTENHEKLWMKCFPNIEKSFIRAQVQNNPEVRHDFFKQYLFEVEVLLDVLFIWIKDFGFKRYSSIDLYTANSTLREVNMIELVEAFASYALCHCSFSNSENVIHKKCIRLFKLIDMTRDSLDFECSSMMNDLVLSRSIQSLPSQKENNPFISSTLESKCILISHNENSSPLCTVEDIVFHQFVLMDYLFRHVSLFESRTLVYKSNSPQNYDPSQTQFMVIKKLCSLFNNLSNYLLVSCLSEQSLEKRSQILEKIEQIKALSFHVNDFSTTMICTSATNSSALGNNKFTLARCQELLGKELHSMVTLISEKCTVKGLRQEAISKESELLVPFLGALLTDISFISESHNDFVSSKYGVIFNCHKYQLMTQTMKRLHSRRMKKPSISTPLISQIPEKTRKLILKRKLGEKILAKLKLIPQQQNATSSQDDNMATRINVQLLEFLTFILFDWKQVEDKTLHDLAQRNEPRRATRDQIKP